MSSVRHRFRRLGPRMVLWTTGFFIVSVIGVSSTIYFLLADSLRRSDREVTERLATTYEQTFFRKGANALQQEITPEFSVKILDDSGLVLFDHPPEYIDHDFEDEDEIRQIREGADLLPLEQGWKTILLLSGEENNDVIEGLEHRLRQKALKNDWSQLLPLIDNDSFEIFVTPISAGMWMKIGRSSEAREEQLSRIRYIAFYVFIPFIFVGGLLGLLLSHGALAPIRDLAGTIIKIRHGDRTLRAHDRGTGDEIDSLAREFNSLLDQNAVLMTNLKSVVDDVAHDLRTPLTRFRISAEDALRNTPDVQRLREALSDALENSENMQKLLNSIMDVSEAESGTMKIHPEVLDLRALIEEVVDLYQYTAEDKDMNVTVEGPSVLISGDKTRLRQAFGNLLDNAIKYSPKGKSVGITIEAVPGKARITFQDQGPGIKAEEIDKIWDRLYRGDESRKIGGLGIGLSLVKAIISIHQGEVSARNLSSGGSIFTVTLPTCHSGERFR